MVKIMSQICWFGRPKDGDTTHNDGQYLDLRLINMEKFKLF